MKVLRIPVFKRALALFLLIIFVQSALLPNYVFALTTGPHQPEYISYEGPGSPDMVNLATGDFTFSLPILDVPGSEGSFSVPLSYHAGIGIDQEASWVGLGWTLNPGAITRSISEYPDDANGESQSITVKDLNVIRGWTSSILGFGQIGWNNQTGHNGSISLMGLLNYNYDDSGPNSLGIAGVNISNSGIKVDPIGVAMAALTIASMGAGGALASSKEILVNAAMDAGIGAGMSAVFSSQTPSVGTNGFWSYSKKVKQKLFHKNYWIWLDKTRTEQMYGTLNLGKATVQPYPAPTSDLASLSLKVNNTTTTLNQFSKSTSGSSTDFQSGVASDMSYYIDPEKEYYEQSSPSGLATDNYNVSGPGISGSIRPYRLEIGSLSMPREMSNNHQRLAPITYLNSYKVPFVYEGSNSSNYFHHMGGAITTPPAANVFNQGISTTVGNSNPNVNTSLAYNLNDYIFASANRINSAVSTTAKIPQQNHIEWYTNDQIKSNVAAANGFVDFTGTTQTRTDFRSSFGFGAMYFYVTDEDFSNGILTISNEAATFFDPTTDYVTLNITHIDENGGPLSGPFGYSNIDVVSKTTGAFSSDIQFNVSGIQQVDLIETSPNALSIEIVVNKTVRPAESIGGYSITNGNGITYHYALPSYDHELLTEIVDKVTPTKYTTVKRQAPFANTWLLTAITGPDYYDFNGNGFPDENDWGYWVRLNYGKHNPATMFYWRSPFQGKRTDADNKTDAHSEGKKELYYLNSIQTRTHTAIFFKELREDGKGYNSQGTQLRLKEIYLVKNEDYKQLTGASGYNLGTCEGTISKVRLMTELDTNSAALNFLNTRCLKRVKFTFSYSLCKNTLAPYSSAVGGGKLTLERISILGRNSQPIAPDYVFSYANNPDYNKDYWDAWGFNNGLNSRIPQDNNSVAAWSLTKVVTPMGNEIQVNYERDDYATIWGSQIRQTEPFNDTDWSDGITINNAYNYAVGDPVDIVGSKSGECTGIPAGEFETPFSYPATITEVGGDYVKVSQATPPTPACTGSFSYYYISGTVAKDIQRKGGDLRVASIVTREDGGQEYKVRYIYTTTGAPGATSSGSLAQEPTYLKSINYTAFPFNLPDFPNTPVIYGKVAVLNGKLSSDSDYDSKQVYEFETPTAGLITYTKSFIGPEKELIFKRPYYLAYHSEYQTKVVHELSYFTARIGRLNSIKMYDKNDALKSTSTFFYKDQLPNNMGIYTEGSILADRLPFMSTPNYYETFNIISRTIKKAYPNVLYKVVNTKDGFTDSSEDLAWDFISGSVTEKITQSSLGVKVKTVLKPAYQFYPELGPKASVANPATNKNMVNPIAAQYVYKLDNANNVSGLISASASTWKKDWSNYRYLNGSVYTEGIQGPDVWRKHKEYFYRASYAALKPDGSIAFAPANEFSFVANATNTGWQLAGEVNRYDHFSIPVETKDLYGRFSSLKTDVDGKLILAQAQNASYFEFAFSGAEDADNTKLFFGGEVERRNGNVITKVNADDVHSGNAAVQVGVNQKTFCYKPASLTPNRTYRVSVWSKSPNGAIYYILNGNEQTILPITTQYIGNWYQINAEIPITSVTPLEVGVKSTSGTITFDDFRFQPLDAAVSANVYNPVTGDLEFALDNNNLYTRYEYNDRGLLIKTYRESLKYQSVKLLTETKDNYKRFNTQQ